MYVYMYAYIMCMYVYICYICMYVPYMYIYAIYVCICHICIYVYLSMYIYVLVAKIEFGDEGIVANFHSPK